MPTVSFKKRFAEFPLSKKIVGFGAFLVVIGSLLPWYQDLDKYQTGDMYLGITGPLYLAGFITLFSGGFSLLMIALDFKGRQLKVLPAKPSQIYKTLSFLSVLMLIIAASAYFHPKFGINISEKNAGMGLIISFFGVGAQGFGTLIAKGKTGKNRKQDIINEPIENIHLSERDHRHMDDINMVKSSDMNPDEIRSDLQEALNDFSDDIHNNEFK